MSAPLVIGGATPATPANPRAWRSCLLAVLASLLAQFALLSAFFPLTALSGDKPILRVDSPFHQWHMEAARQLCLEGRASGFDPQVAAGTAVGLVPNASAKSQALLACLSGRDGSVAALYKQVDFAFGLIGPACIVVAAWLFGLPAGAVWATAALAVAGWWIGGVRWYQSAGMVSYVASSYLTVPFVVWVARLVSRPAAMQAAAAMAVAGAGMFIHPLFPVGAVLAGLALVAVDVLRSRRFGWSLALLLAISAAMLVLNIEWILGSVASLGTSAHPQPFQKEVLPALVWQEAIGQASTAGGGMRLGVALLIGCAMAILMTQGVQRRRLVALVAGGVLLFLWASFGALSPAVASLQPNRFSIQAWQVLIVPAGAGLHAGWVARHALHRRTARWLLRAGLVVAGLVYLFVAREALREVFGPPDIPRYAAAPPAVNGVGPTTAALRDFFRARSGEAGRVLFEMSLGRIHDGAHVAAWLAHATGREFIGGPYVYKGYANAWDGYALGAPFGERTAAEWARMLDLYNVRWMACHSDACRTSMQEVPGAVRAAVLGPVTVYDRGSSPGYVLSGQGRVSASCVNRVEVEASAAAAADGGEAVILAYQWMPGMRVVPAGRAEPVVVAPGVPPFVAVRGAPASFALRIGDGPGVPCAGR